MSFAIWNEKPPFEFAPDDVEQVYQVGDKWVVTDDPARATQEEIDAVLASASEIPSSGAGMEQRQRSQAMDSLDAAIAKLPADQRDAFNAVKQLLEK